MRGNFFFKFYFCVMMMHNKHSALVCANHKSVAQVICTQENCVDWILCYACVRSHIHHDDQFENITVFQDLPDDRSRGEFLHLKYHESKRSVAESPLLIAEEAVLSDEEKKKKQFDCV